MPIATKPPALLKHYPMVQVRKGAHDSFSSSLIAAASFAKDQKIAPLEGFTISPRPTYLTVQIKEDVHVDLNSDFVYMNHSCDPNVTIDLRQMAYVACKDIREGDELFFFYPSTEWSMDQPFACWCHSEKVGLQAGPCKIRGCSPYK